jgi:hypothetical protein
MGFLLWLVVVVLVFGVLCYVVQQLPLPHPWKNIAFAVLALVFVLWLLSAAGAFGPVVLVPVR